MVQSILVRIKHIDLVQSNDFLFNWIALICANGIVHSTEKKPAWEGVLIEFLPYKSSFFGNAEGIH